MTSVTCLNLLESSQLTQGDHRPENGQRISQQVKFKFGQCHSATKDFLISSGKAALLSALFCNTFQPPKARGIGTNHALLFEAWAHCLEAFGPQKHNSFSIFFSGRFF
jgi:hypothetical protein